MLFALSTGCLRLAGSEDPTPAPTAVQPESTPGAAGDEKTASPPRTATEPAFPRGLTPDGVEPFLADVHTNALARDSFQTGWIEANLTRGMIVAQRTYRIEAGSAIGEWVNDGPITAYLDNEGGYWQEELGNQATYGQLRHGFDLSRLTRRAFLRRNFLAGDWEPPTREANDPAAFRITTAGMRDTSALAEEFEADSLESFTAEGVVGETGIVRNLGTTVEFTPRREDRLLQFQTEFEVTAVGEVSVSEPPWVETAREQAPSVDAGMTDDRRFVEVSMRSGNPMLPGTALVLYDEVERINAVWYEFQDPFESGETGYVYRVDGSPRFARGSRPSDVTPDRLESEYSIWAHRGGAEYFVEPNLT